MSARNIHPGIATEAATAATLQSMKDEDKTECPICYGTFIEMQELHGLSRQRNTTTIGLMPITPIDPYMRHFAGPRHYGPMNVLVTTCHHASGTLTTPKRFCTNPMTLTACGHTLCATCLTTWLRADSPFGKRICPYCRTALAGPPPHCLDVMVHFDDAFSTIHQSSNPLGILASSHDAYNAAAATGTAVHFSAGILIAAAAAITTVAVLAQTTSPAAAPWPLQLEYLQAHPDVWRDMFELLLGAAKRIALVPGAAAASAPATRYLAPLYSRRNWERCRRRENACLGFTAPAEELKRALVAEIYGAQLRNAIPSLPPPPADRTAPSGEEAEVGRKLFKLAAAALPVGEEDEQPKKTLWRCLSAHTRREVPTPDLEWMRMNAIARVAVGWLVLQTERAVLAAA
ncbi:hypothetical protein SLS58_011263 [Diplodia intermedia]|uniref:RING-type domain-containing protein n=1 Tax=Diplodia intermedia TaxID=856260 RepID=A0ABR3T0B8_9PEZI